MKVLFFISSFPKLSETFILSQITGLINRGVDVEILSWNEVYTSQEHGAVAEYKLRDKTTYIQIPENKIKRFLKGAGIFIKEFFKHPYLAMDTLNGKKHGQMAYSLRLLYALDYFSKRKKADAVICHYGPNGNIASFFKQHGLLEEKTMVFFHGHDLTSFVEKWGDAIYSALFQTDIELLPVSDYFAKKLIQLGANQETICKHAMGINPTEFSYIEPRVLEGELQLLTIGRLTEKKGIDKAIEVVHLLKERGISVKLSVLGDGELRTELTDLITKLDVADCVTLHGWKTQDEINIAIEQTDILIQLSRTAKTGDMEGIPMVLMEGMARGKIVLSTYHSGIPELITSGDNGWLVAENNIEEAADKIEEIIANKEQWRPMSKAAQAKIEADFDIEKWNDRLISKLK
ncbi:colanic acid biosynthesis glycosyltransferase WcaL [Listeria rocourtiae]|uniref:glycosyltransferase n=1 Tax=Listeria rocourtiae TaxID=647910 RepID=UPI001628C5FA|nr:glycosyltransferase [Listeria rocourtiae]MBC1605343.1 colanic acid biosynthesis glycosyltransferase WcaL [Listeria rocourtiae]